MTGAAEGGSAGAATTGDGGGGRGGVGSRNAGEVCKVILGTTEGTGRIPPCGSATSVTAESILDGGAKGEDFLNGILLLGTASGRGDKSFCPFDGNIPSNEKILSARFVDLK